MEKERQQARRGEFSLTAIILAIVVLFILVAAGPWVYRLFFSDSSVESCRASVNIKAGSLKLTVNLVDVAQLDLACHTVFLTAQEDGIYQGAGRQQKVTSFSDRRFEGYELEEKLKIAVADSMKDCWYMFGKGEIDPFTNLGGDHCIVCYEISFKTEGDQKIGETTLGGFNQFLLTEEQGGLTYGSYLYGAAASEALKQDFDIDTAKTYAVVYSSNNMNLFDFFGVAACGVAGPAAPLCASLVVNVVFSSSDGQKKNMGVSVLPVDELGDRCKKLY